MKDLLKNNVVVRSVTAFTLVAFFFLSVIPSQVLAQGVLGLPQPGAMVPLSPSFYPVLLRGVQVHPDNPLRFDFIMDTGDTGLEGEAFKEEAQKIIKYFLASLTVPEDEFWVNLSPYEQDRIIADMLGQTEMGRDLLAQDYMLKQLTATLIHPDNEFGKAFWDRVYKKAYEMYGTTQVPVNTFNKVWIVPDEAVVYEHGTYAFVGERHLKVMLEEDYLSLEQNAGNKALGMESLQKQDIKETSKFSSEIVKNILVPEIEKEVNEGKTFSNLRQIFDAMILATWYKKTLKQSLLGQIYADKNKIQGIDLDDKTMKDQIYNQYLETFKKGVFDLVKVEHSALENKNIPRKYFSGGVSSGIMTRAGLKKYADAVIVQPLQRLGKNFQKLFSSKSRRVTVDLVTVDLVREDNFDKVREDLSAEDQKDFLEKINELLNLLENFNKEPASRSWTQLWSDISERYDDVGKLFRKYRNSPAVEKIREVMTISGSLRISAFQYPNAPKTGKKNEKNSIYRSIDNRIILDRVRSA